MSVDLNINSILKSISHKARALEGKLQNRIHLLTRTTKDVKYNRRDEADMIHSSRLIE